MVSTWPRAALAPLLFLLTFLVLARLATDQFNQLETIHGLIAVAARVCFLVLCVVGLVVCSLREKSLMIIAFVLSCILIFSSDFLRIFAASIDIASFFGVFIAMLTVMKEAATRSKSVEDVGIYLTSQPPGRRFYSVAIGSHVLGAFLNFSAVSLISPLVQKGARASTTEPPDDLERRQLSALIRGFSWILLWAPTTLTQAVLLTLFTDINYTQLITLGLASAVLMIAIGRIFDRIEWPRTLVNTIEHGVILPKHAFWVVSSVCSILLMLTYILKFVAGFTVAESLMFVAPSVTLGWLLMQKNVGQNHHPSGESFEGIGLILTKASPDLVRSTIALGLSGYIGRVAASLLPAADMANWMSPENLPSWVFLAMLPIIITLGGQIALSPIVFVVFLGQIITAFPELPADPTHIVFALSVGWALSMTASPNATATLLMAATCKIPPTTLTWKWNLHYALTCYFVFVLMFYVLSS